MATMMEQLQQLAGENQYLRQQLQEQDTRPPQMAAETPQQAPIPPRPIDHKKRKEQWNEATMEWTWITDDEAEQV